MQFNQINTLVEKEMEAVNTCLRQCLDTKVSLINDLGHYVIQRGGKRLRPLVTLLGSYAAGNSTASPIPVAAAIECIHTATLLHDDVVDTADYRHNEKTANLLWGNSAAILVGDFLYAQAFQLLLNTQNFQILQTISQATRIMAEGEAMQLLARKQQSMTEAQYFIIIQSKTAQLFQAATLSGALLTPNLAPTLRNALATYGLHLGTAFQLIDDVLDYEGTLQQLGKRPGTDLAEGKLTLPLVYALENSRSDEREYLERALSHQATIDFAEIQAILKRNGALEYTRQQAAKQIAQAHTMLEVLPKSVYQEALASLATFALHRKY